MGIDDESSHPELCSEVADGVTQNIVCLFREPDAVTPPVRFDKRGCGNVALVRLLRHRQTKGPVSARPHLNRRATPRLHLKIPAHALSLPYPARRNAPHQAHRPLFTSLSLWRAVSRRSTSYPVKRGGGCCMATA